MENKKPWLSKTIIVNAIVSLAGILSTLGFMPSLAEWMSANVSIMLSVLGVVGIGLRAITKDKIKLSE